MSDGKSPTANRITMQDCLVVTASCQGLEDITAKINGWARSKRLGQGLLTLFIRHTSASLLMQENWDSDVLRDLEDHFDSQAPEVAGRYRHSSEGPDDMPAHIKSALTQTHLVVPVSEGRLLLGRYQGIFLFEHRRRTRPREIILHFDGN